MGKLIVTADVHGRYSSWLTLKTLLGKEDKLIIAGDLFDTRYGNYAHSDFKPETIKEELKTFSNDLVYVYGNCDIPSYFPGYQWQLMFKYASQSIFLHHGHAPVSAPARCRILIQGHTHLCALETSGGVIMMNPGSISCPRNGLYTYGIIDHRHAAIVELKTGKELAAIDF